MSEATAKAESVSHRLKTETRELHTAAEKAPFQAAMVKGEQPLEAYAALLGQMLHVHRAVEGALAECGPKSSLISSLGRLGASQAALAAADLETLGHDPDSLEPLEPTAALVSRVESIADDPAALAGTHYVLEGANNGNRFIARVLERAYGLSVERGLRYLDPHGQTQAGRWSSYKSALDDAGLSAEEADRTVESAKAMFRAIIEIHAALEARRPDGGGSTAEQ